MNRVHIELQRVQTWLFTVPRLRAMVGANALLGETLRVALPNLARQVGQWSLAPLTEACPAADENDPLRAHDAPGSDARDGILSRDGGHFEALFASGAEAFADEAASLLRRELPGLRFRVSIDGNELAKSHVHLSTELPVLAPCEWTGHGLASTIIEQGDDEHPAVSLDVSRRHDAARRTEDGAAKDLASLLSATTKLKALQRPQELKDLVGSGYLALIHADGNGVGSAGVTGDAARTAFFHRNRMLLRRAVQRAIDVVCNGETEQAPLMTSSRSPRSGASVVTTLTVLSTRRPPMSERWVRQTLVAELLSEAHLGTGSGGGGIDALVARDRHGRPALWASHIEGVLRDAARRLRRDGTADSFFGRAGGDRQRAVFTSLYADADPGSHIWRSTARESFDNRAPKGDTPW